MKTTRFFSRWVFCLVASLLLFSSGGLWAQTTGSGTQENPYTVEDVNTLNSSSKPKAWVVGYIIGANNSGKLVNNVNSNIVLAVSPETNSIIQPQTISVALPSGSIRDALNVSSNSGNIGKKVKIKGTLEAYFSKPGLKSPTEYEFVTETCGDPTSIKVTATDVTASITWTAPTPAPAKYAIFLKAPTITVRDTVTENSFNFRALAPSTDYQYSITSLCSENVVGTEQTGSFTTLAPIHSVSPSGETYSYDILVGSALSQTLNFVGKNISDELSVSIEATGDNSAAAPTITVTPTTFAVTSSSEMAIILTTEAISATEGTYTYNLKFTEDAEVLSTSTISLTVKPNNSSFIEITSPVNGSITDKEVVEVTVSFSNIDAAEGNTIVAEVRKDGEVVVEKESVMATSPQTFSLPALASDEYTLNVSMKNEEKVLATAAPVSFSVALGNLTDRTVSLNITGTELENGHYRDFVEIKSVTVSSSITGYEDAIVKYNIAKGNEPVGEYIEFPAEGVKIAAVGKHTFYCTVKVANYNPYPEYIILEIDSLHTPMVVINPKGGFFVDGPTVNLSCSLDGTQIRYTLDGESPTEASALYSNPIKIESTTTIKARAYKAGYVSDSVAYETYTLPGIVSADLPMSLNGGIANIDVANGWYQEELGSDYNSEPKLKFGSTGAFIIAACNSSMGTVKYTIKNNSLGGAYEFKVEVSADAQTWTAAKTYNTGSPITGTMEEVLTDIPSEMRYIRWIYSNKATGNVALGSISINALEKELLLSDDITIGTIATNTTATVSINASGKLLTEAVSVTNISGNAAFSINKAQLTTAELFAEGGIDVVVTYTPTKVGKDTAIIEFKSSEVVDTVKVYASATETISATSIADLYTHYSDANLESKVFTISSDVIVTHKDINADGTHRIWVQDKEKAAGRSIIIYKDKTDENIDLSTINVGDALNGVTGGLKVYNNLLEFIPTELPSASSTGNTVYVDTVTVANLKANVLRYQNSLICVKDVNFAQNGTFASKRNYNLAQGKDTVNFRTDYITADYIGVNISQEKLYITAIVAQYREDAQITARNAADMSVAPCLLPYDISVSTTETTATASFSGVAANYKYRYAATEEGLEAAEEVAISKKGFELSELTGSTTYYYQIKSICSEASQSEWTEAASFTTISALSPSLTLRVPKTDSVFIGEVSFAYDVENFELGIDGKVSIKIEEREAVVTTELSYAVSLLSGSYTAVVGLVDMEGAALEPAVSVERNFSVDLPNVETPTITPDANAVYTEAIDVSIACATADAKIYYTTDGSTPTEMSNLYAEPFNIASTTTIKAIAIKEGMDTSEVAIATYKLIVNPVPVGEIVFKETFAGFKAGSFGSEADSKDISSELDKYTQTIAWSGSKVYQAGGMAKMGGSSALGVLTTPSIDLNYDEGKYYIAFYAKAWVKDADELRLIVDNGTTKDTTVVSPLDNSADYTSSTLREFVYEFTNGSATTKITFEGNQASKGRFFLDSLRIYQTVPAVPTITVPSTLSLSTLKGYEVSQEITVTGKLLTGDVSVAVPEKSNFSVSPATLSKTAIMSDTGAKFTVKYNGALLADTVDVILTETGGSALTKTMKVYASAESITEVEDLYTLQESEEGKYYKVTGEVVISAIDSYRNTKWIQGVDGGGIMIDDNAAKITTEYKVGDGLTGIVGKLGSFGGQKQFVPYADFGAANSTDNELLIETLTITELKDMLVDYVAMVVEVKGLRLVEPTGKWESNKDHYAYVGTDTINIRTFVRNGSYVGETKPAGEFSLYALVGDFNGTAQLSPRTKEDIMLGGEEPSECETPTGLKATNVSTTGATLSWEGTASDYTVMYKVKGTDSWATEDVSAKSTSLKGLTPKTTYQWKVQANCSAEEISDFSAISEFTTSPLSIEGLSQSLVRLYPNPTEGRFVIETPVRSTIEIYSLSGSKIESRVVEMGTVELSIKESGIYLVRISDANHVIVKRLVVR